LSELDSKKTNFDSFPTKAQVVVVGGGITPDDIKSANYEIEVASVRYPATASLRPMYDPKNQRVRS
jgi:hypothetical protein